MTTWTEPLGAGLLEFQETAAVSGPTTVEYWVFGSGHRRCVLNGDFIYSKEGYLLSANFWRNDRQLLFVNSPAFPSDFFPSRIPPSAVFLSLNAQKPGGSGKLNSSLGRYLTNSTQIELDQWRHRPIHERFDETIAGSNHYSDCGFRSANAPKD